jgi:glycosidase
MAGSILDAVANGRGAGLAARHAHLRQQYGEVFPGFIDATFLSNHDQNRVMSVLSDDEDRARVAAALLLTLPGSPFIYYGEEIGMRGLKPDFFIREPMLWQRQPDPWRARPREVRHSKDHKVTPVAAQSEDKQSLLNHYQTLIGLRNRTPALAQGEFEPLEDLHERLAAFIRRHPSGDVLVIHNVSRRTTSADLPPSAAAFTRQIWTSDEKIKTSPDRVTIPPYSTLVLGK